MTREQQAAYITAQAACASAEVAAMQAENTAAAAMNANAPLDRRLPLPWKGDDFFGVINKYGIHHNAVLSFFS